MSQDTVHDVKRADNHGMQDQKYVKGNRAPVSVHGGDGLHIQKASLPDLGAATPMVQPAVDAYNKGVDAVNSGIDAVKGFFGSK